MDLEKILDFLFRYFFRLFLVTGEFKHDFTSLL